ncbi:MAG: competence/damage-inducible protein A [Desulfobacterales bacterium]|nr:MAG: competence/damage-inducible protein A [Desulfobacterales bacterium]
MFAEILITGQEIIAGDIVDSNSAQVAQMLTEVGLKVTRHHCVGDDIKSLIGVIKEISMRADFAVVTGGLGPTQDDITAEAAARSAGMDLILDKSALMSIEAYFKARKRSISDSNKKQAMLPAGTECLDNPIGTAPGFYLKIEACSFFFLPGVPFEMRAMLSDAVIPKIRDIMGSREQVNLTKTISIFGQAEAEIGEKLSGLSRQFPEVYVGIRAKFPEIYAKLYCHGKDRARLEQRIEKASGWVLKQIGDNAFSSSGKSMEAVIGKLLARKKATLAVAESCTGGLISHWLTNIPGSSDFFLFAGVTYSNNAKMDVIGVSSEILNQYGAVHEETAKQMATGVKRVSGATYGLSTSGIAGPSGGTEDKPVGTVCIGLATPYAVKGFRFFFPFNRRSRNKKIFAMTALDLLRKDLLSESVV